MSGFNSVHRLTPLKVSILTTQHPQTPTVRVSQDAPTLAQGPGESHRTPEGVVPSASCRLGPAGGSGEQGLCQPRDPAAGRADPAAGLKGGHAGPEGHPGNSRHRDTTPTQPEQRAAQTPPLAPKVPICAPSHDLSHDCRPGHGTETTEPVP